MQVELRDLDLLAESIRAQGGMSQSVALEAEALMPGFLSEDRPVEYFTKHPSRTLLSVALEEIDENKKSALEKVLNAIIAFLRRIFGMITKFLSGVDYNAERERAQRAAKIAENQEKMESFGDEVMKRLPKPHLAVLATIHHEKEFLPTFFENVKLDRSINTPEGSRWVDERENEKADKLAQTASQLHLMIIKWGEESESIQRLPLSKMLTEGISIDGAEHGAYFKDFLSARDERQRFEGMLKAAEQLSVRGPDVEEKVKSIQKIAHALGNQYVIELKVVQSYMRLNKEIIAVNDKIHEGAD